MASLSSFLDGDRLDRIGPGNYVANPIGLYVKAGAEAKLYLAPSTTPVTPTLFTDLTDTPSSYTGRGGRPLRINLAETGIEALPAGAPFTATEALASGMLVNIIPGTSTCQRADASLSREANGYVLAAVATGDTAVVHTDGHNDQLTALTIGPRYLAANGLTTSVKPLSGFCQYVGDAVSATRLAFDPDQPMVLL